MAEMADELCPPGEIEEVLPFFIKTPNNRVSNFKIQIQGLKLTFFISCNSGELQLKILIVFSRNIMQLIKICTLVLHF